MMGRFDVAVGDRTVPEEAWRARRARDLVKILALVPGRRLHREQVIERLWPGSDAPAGANNLHQALYALRRVLDPGGHAGPGLVALRDNVVSLSPDAPAWIDVAAFQAAAARARATSDPADLRAAVAAYGGELLPDDPYEDWAAGPRRALAAEHLWLLFALAAAAADSRRWQEAEQILTQVLTIDPAHEPSHRLLMRVFASTGRRQQALRQFQVLRVALAEELGADPDPSTDRLHRELLMGSPDAPEEEPAGALGTSPLPVLPARLLELPTSFVGRDREMAEIARLLAGTRLLVLTGPGGSGKTRLALETARRSSGSFPDAVGFVSLGAIAPGRPVEGAVAAALGVHEQPGFPLTDTIAAAIGRGRLLLILDNCEHLVGACAALTEALLQACARLCILATSREPLRIPGEVVWVVPSLSLPDPARPQTVEAVRAFGAVRLFEERATAAYPPFALTNDNAGAVVRLCHRLDGLPLALELAAARVRLLSPAHMLERLGEGFDLLSADSRTALTRQQTLRATLDWSYGLLSDDERTLFRRLATFAGTFDVESCERVCVGGPVPAQAVLGLLAGLAEKSLLVVDPGEGRTRYRLLETIRDYAREALTRSGEGKDLRTAHARWCQEVVGGLRGPDLAGRAAWSERLELLRDDLRLAFTWLLDRAPDEALALAARVAEVMLVRGHVAEIRGWLQSGLAAAPARTGARATALMELCNVIARVGSNTECIELANESLSIAADLGDRSAMGRAMHGVGVFLWMVEDFGAARDMFERSLDLAREDENGEAGAVALHSLGALEWRCGRFEEAERRLAECRELLDELGGGGDRHLLLINAGALGLRRAFDGGWWPVQEETAIPFLGTPPRLAPAMVLANLGALSRARGAYGQARDRLERSLAQLEALGDRATIAQVVARMGFVAADEGGPAEARRRFDRALELYRAAGDARALG